MFLGGDIRGANRAAGGQLVEQRRRQRAPPPPKVAGDCAGHRIGREEDDGRHVGIGGLLMRVS